MHKNKMNSKYDYIKWRLEFLVLQYQIVCSNIFNEKLIFKPTLLIGKTLDRIEYFVNGEIWFRVYTDSFLPRVKMPVLIKRKDTCYQVLLKLRILNMVNE